MNRLEKVRAIRTALRSGSASIGSWMQIPESNIAEIMGRAGYQWVAIDMEHGPVAVNQLPDIFRALELGGTLPLARVASPLPINCRQALDQGAAGVVIPMISSASQLQAIISECHWPPRGRRGVGFQRANVFGIERVKIVIGHMRYAGQQWFKRFTIFVLAGEAECTHCAAVKTALGTDNRRPGQISRAV